MNELAQGIDDLVTTVMTDNYDSTQRGVLSTWTIFHKPLDWPDGYIARRFEITKDGGVPTTSWLAGADTDSALQLIRNILSSAGMVMLARSDEDHSTVVETWV